MSKEERIFKLPGASLNLSPNALSKKRTVVVVMWYKTLHSFMTHTSFEDTSNTKVSSKIIIASVRPEPQRKTFEDPVRISWNSTELVFKVIVIFALKLLIRELRVGFNKKQLKTLSNGGYPV